MVDEVLELEIEADPRSSSRARRSVASWLAAKDFPGEQLDDWLVVVSEIVTNAVLHARTTSRIVVRWNGRRVLVEVFDGRADELPRVRDEPPAVGGRGLFLVEQLSTEWGVENVPSGKCVWAALEMAP